MPQRRKQALVFAALLAANALLAFLAYAAGLQNQALETMPGTTPPAPAWVLGLANAGLILVLYGALGWLGIWLGHKAGLPSVLRVDAGWRRWAVLPAVVGLALGIFMTLIDALLAASGRWGGLAHPPFPLSLIASATAGIGEEILFRGFMMGLWAWLAGRLLRHWNVQRLALWIGNGVAALAFAAGHLPAAMLLVGVASPAELPPLLLVEILALNGIVGLVCGQRYMRDGLVAAIGVHFWADVAWHVIWPMLAAG